MFQLTSDMDREARRGRTPLDKTQSLPRFIGILGDSVAVDSSMAHNSLVVLLFDGRLRMPAAG